jgi:hypothetical protein
MNLINKKFIIFSSVALVGGTILLVNTTAAFNPYVISSQKKEVNQSVTTLDGTDIYIKDDSILPTKGVNPEEMSNKAAVMSKSNDKIYIVDKEGKVIDDLGDLAKKMSGIKIKHEDESEKHIQSVIGAGHLVNRKLYYTSNYDSKNGQNSVWQMNLESREVKKLVSSEKYGNISFISANDDNLLLLSDLESSKSMLVIEMGNDGNIVEHKIPGHVINSSPDNNKISFRYYKSEGILDNTFGIYDIKTRTIIEIPQTNKQHLFNNYGSWSQSSGKFAFMGIYIDGKIEKHVVYVYDLNNQALTEIIEPSDSSFKAGFDNLVFENNSELKIPLINENYFVVTLN